MNNEQCEFYVLQYDIDEQYKFVAIDDASGGYPYQCCLKDAFRFNTESAAQKYNISGKLIVRKVSMCVVK